MGKLSEEIGELVEDYVPARIVKLPEEKELENETEDVDETVDETETETTDETSEVVDEEEGEETEESTEENEVEETEATEETEDAAGEDEGEKPNPLLEQLNALASGQLDIKDEEIEKTPEKPAEQTPTEVVDEFDLLGGIEFDDVVSKPEVFKQVIERAGERMRETIKTQVLQAVTQIAGYQVQQQMALQNLTNKFWEVNRDLEPVRPYVAKIASTIQSKRPDMPLQKIFEKTAEIARKNLGLPEPKGGGGVPIQKRGSKPALVKSGGGVRQTNKTPQTTKLENEIADLIDL